MSRRVKRVRKLSDHSEMRKDAFSAEDPQDTFQAFVEQFNHMCGKGKDYGISVIGMLYQCDPLSEDEEMAWFNNANMPSAIGLSQMLCANIANSRGYSPVVVDDDDDYELEV